MPRSASNRTRNLISFVIATVLGLQFAAVVVRPSEYGWPFTNYPMYARSHQEGERVLAAYHVFAVLEDGSEVELAPEDIGLTYFYFRKWVDSLLREAEGNERTRQRSALRSLLRSWFVPETAGRALMGPVLIRRFEALHDQNIVQLRIEDTPVVLTRDGMAEAPVQVLKVLNLSERNREAQL